MIVSPIAGCVVRAIGFVSTNLASGNFVDSRPSPLIRPSRNELSDCSVVRSAATVTSLTVVPSIFIDAVTWSVRPVASVSLMLAISFSVTR